MTGKFGQISGLLARSGAITRAPIRRVGCTVTRVARLTGSIGGIGRARRWDRHAVRAVGSADTIDRLPARRLNRGLGRGLGRLTSLTVGRGLAASTNGRTRAETSATLMPGLGVHVSSGFTVLHGLALLALLAVLWVPSGGVSGPRIVAVPIIAGTAGFETALLSKADGSIGMSKLLGRRVGRATIANGLGVIRERAVAMTRRGRRCAPSAGFAGCCTASPRFSCHCCGGVSCCRYSGGTRWRVAVHACALPLTAGVAGI